MKSIEIETRIKRAQVLMEELELEGMILTAESNVCYYSGYRTHAPWTTFTRPLWFFLPRQEKPVLFVQTFVQPEAENKSFACDVNCFDSLKGPSIEEVDVLVKKLGMAEGKIGLELGYEQRIGIQIDTLKQMEKNFSSVEFVDASSIIWKQRMIKSPYEISCHRRACEATSYAHDKIFSEIKSGMSEHEISRLAKQYMLQGGADSAGFVIIVSGENNYKRISGISTDRKLANGDMLWLDLGAQYQGYWSDFCRAGVVGDISNEREYFQSCIKEVTCNAINHLKPGVPVSQIAEICAANLIKRKFPVSFDCGRMGHGMGLMSTEPPSVTPYDQTILEEGMIINLEPGIVNNTGVFDIEENMVITASGCEVLSGGTREIHRIDD